MGLYLVPSYIKPYSKILSWTLPMIYVEEEKQEYISDLKVVVPVIKGEIRYFARGEKLTMKTDMRGNPEQYKVLPDTSTQVLVPLEDFITKVTENKQYGEIQGKINLLTNQGIELIEKIYNLLDEDLRPVISLPMQWLVYIPNKKELTRLCWTIDLEGEIIVRPYGTTGLLLEVGDARLDKINSVSLKEIKKNTLIRQRLNDHWRSLVASFELGELAEEFATLEEYTTEEEKEEVKEKVGEIE